MLSSLGFYSAQNELLPWSYVLHIKNKTTFPIDLNDPNISKEDQECIELIKRTNKLAILRSYAFEIFSLTPTELRKSYIDEYFKLVNENDVESFIVKQTSDLAQTHSYLEDQLQVIINRVRQEAFTSEFKLLNDSQKEICELQFSKDILVNAGPGSGKTRVLIMRAVHMIHRQGLQPEEILILAFNRAVVYEIRSRITELFRQLGYGNYASRIQIYTFHAFAMKYSNNADDKQELENVLHEFTEKILVDDILAKRTTDGIRCIMIDEFQDMNEDFYKLIVRLREVSKSGILAIGDDDQDILLWNRLQWKKDYGNTKLHSNEYFESFQNYFKANIITKNLTINYRSCKLIVEQSQNLLKNDLIKNNRIKKNVILSTENQCEGSVEEISCSNFEKIITEIWNNHEQNKSIAILCRTNYDCYEVAQVIDNYGLPYNVLGESDYPLNGIRNVGHWVESCKSYLDSDNYSNQILTDSLFNKILDIYEQINIPMDLDVKQLWHFTIKENQRANLYDHIKFLKETKKSDLLRMLRSINTNQILISTINKVKGLEFDIVYMKSSKSQFPFGKNNLISIQDLALEEYRLWYVGMTRTKEKLFYEKEDREKCWELKKTYDGVENNLLVLSGSLDEVEISWPAKNDSDQQDYIKNFVNKDDLITRSYGKLIHNGKKIGYVSTKVWNKIERFQNSHLKVSEVLRYFPKIDDAQKYGVAHKYIEQGWHYTVLFKGKIW